MTTSGDYYIQNGMILNLQDDIEQGQSAVKPLQDFDCITIGEPWSTRAEDGTTITTGEVTDVAIDVPKLTRVDPANRPPLGPGDYDPVFEEIDKTFAEHGMDLKDLMTASSPVYDRRTLAVKS